MNTPQAFRRLLTSCGLFCLLVSPCFGFALLGPYEDWMQVSNSFRLSQAVVSEGDLRQNDTYTPGDIGGPMPIGSEYRWNAPVISYAFDQSFIDYFGAEGMHEVEAAFKLLSQLPRASEIDPLNYPRHVTRPNYPAMTIGLYDLKSTTLSLLLEQLGLTQPTRNIVVVRRMESRFEGYFPASVPFDPAWSDYFYRRNYDPTSCMPSFSVNGNLYEFAFLWPVWQGSQIGDTIEFPADHLVWGFQAVADGLPNAGYFFSSLTRDDVGGLRYLLSFTNINFEAPLPDVHRLGAFGGHERGPDSAPPVAWRPGVEKIHFVRHPYFPKRNRSLPLRRRYMDYYYEDGKLRGRRVERVISQPDILFTVDNGEDTPPEHAFLYTVTRTGITNWVNNAASNGNMEGNGPGNIVPPIKFVFRRLGKQIDMSLGPRVFLDIRDRSWASFSSNTVPVVYPGDASKRKLPAELTIRQIFWDPTGLYGPLPPAQFWKLPLPIGGLALLQNSSNGTNWTTQLTVTNDGRVAEWNCYPSSPTEVFRVIPE